MPQHSNKNRDLKALRNKVIGLGDESLRKSYYPELQQRLVELQESESRFRAIFDSVNDSIVLYDIDTFNVHEVNQSACELFECTYEQALQLKPNDLPYIDSPSNIQDISNTMRKAQSGTIQYCEWYIKTCKGKPIWVDVNIRRAQIGSEDRLLATFRDITERKKLEDDKRAFYRDTILSATDGKLDICEKADIRDLAQKSELIEMKFDSRNRNTARHNVEIYLHKSGLNGHKYSDFMIGIVEAMANALKHCGNGTMYAGSNSDQVWIIISDNGPGIDSLILPRAVLKKGFSTRPSMGLGYSIMLEVCDHIMLSTGKTGTDVVLIKKLREVKDTSLDQLPDTWEGIVELKQ